MEADKSEDLQSASWIPRRVNGVILVWVQRPKNKESPWCSFSLKAGRLKTQEETMSQFESKGKCWYHGSEAIKQRELPLTQLFCFIQASRNWMRPTHIKEVSLLNLQIQMLISFKNTLPDTLRIMFYQISRHFMAQPTWHLKLTTIWSEIACSWMGQFNIIKMPVFTSPIFKFNKITIPTGIIIGIDKLTHNLYGDTKA